MPYNAPAQTDIHVGRRIHIRRNTIGMSQVVLARALGITFQQIQKYERGINRVSAGRLQAIATALDVPVAYFFEGSDSQANWHSSTAEATPNFTDEFLTDRRGIKIARMFAYMSAWQRDALLAVAETLSQHSSTKGE